MLVQRRTGGFGALVEVPELGVVLCQRTRTGGARRVGGHTGQTQSPTMGRGRGKTRQMSRDTIGRQREKTREIIR